MAEREATATTASSSAVAEKESVVNAEFRGVCRAIQVCQKNFGLYPPSHPRVEASLHELREALGQFCEVTGQPFEFTTMGPADGHKGADDAALDALRESLMQHFVRSVSISARASTDELSDVCQLLAHQPDDESAATPSEMEADFSSWQNIKLSFYLPENFRELNDTTTTAMGRATGIQNFATLAPILDSVSDRVRSVICNAILNEDLLGRLHTLRDSLKRGQLTGEQEAEPSSFETEDMDVVSEILYTILAESAQLEDLEVTEERIRTTLGSLLDFMENNVESFRRGLNLYRGDEAGCSVTRQIRDAIHSGFELSGEVSDMEAMKERLAFLFQISEDGTPQHREHVAALEEEDDTARNSSYFGVDETASSQRPLDETMREIGTDLALMAEEMRAAAGADNFIDVVLELLDRRASREVVRESWAVLERQIARSAHCPRFIDEAFHRVISVYQTQPNDDLETLLTILLKTSDFPSGEGFRACEALVKTSAGKRFVSTFLDRYCEDRRDEILPTLTKLRHASSARLRKIGNQKLAEACSRPSMLEKLATEEPGVLCSAETLSLLTKSIPLSRLRDGFQRVFDCLDVPQARNLLKNFPAGLEGGEEILFVASQNALGEVRRAAVANLHKYPTSVVVKTLVGIVEGQNQQPRPCLDDVEAALTSLVRIDSPAAQAFLQEVATSRKLLGHAYRKDIRRILAELQPKGGSST